VRVLITGGLGFIGRSLVVGLSGGGEYRVIASARCLDRQNIDVPLVRGELRADFDWADALAGADIVIHTAARAHVMRDEAADPLAEFRRVNVHGTLSLARQASVAGVRRFVFISSAKVNGEVTEPGRPFTEIDTPSPAGPYGVSKMEAERGLAEVGRATGMEIVIVRPPLVYGPGVRANFESMIRWLDRGVPLPLGAIDNRRSFVALDNLIDLILICTRHPAAANQTFLVSDDEDLSTTSLLERLAQAMGKAARLIPVPPALLRAGATLIGRSAMAQRLCGSLQLDISKARQMLGWEPVVSIEEGLQRTVDHWKAVRRHV
jgi:nucleoside-diphosphate-sugar epimerase